MSNGFRHLPRVSGARIGQIAKITYVCHGCGTHYPVPKPAQCAICGRMDFGRFDSKAEARRWAVLEGMQAKGLIRNLRRQVSFDLRTTNLDNGMIATVARYVADAVYDEKLDDGWQLVVEDVKGGITDLAALKLKWMAGQGIPVRIVT